MYLDSPEDIALDPDYLATLLLDFGHHVSPLSAT
jgi:hypothetical protein